MTYISGKSSLRGNADEINLGIANETGAIIVTSNVADYDKAIARRPPDNHNRYRHTSLIALVGRERQHASRITAVLDLIEFEFQRRQGMSDKRVIVEVRQESIVIW